MTELPVDPTEAKREAMSIRERHGVWPSDSAKFANVIMPSLREAAGFTGAIGGSLGASAHPPEGCDEAATYALLDELLQVYRHGEA